MHSSSYFIKISSFHEENSVNLNWAVSLIRIDIWKQCPLGRYEMLCKAKGLLSRDFVQYKNLESFSWIHKRNYFCLAVQKIGFKLKTWHSNKLRSNGSVLSTGEMTGERDLCIKFTRVSKSIFYWQWKQLLVSVA